MRFKKLRVAVGVSIVIFIFLVGTVLYMGQLSDKSKITGQNTDLQTNIVPAVSGNKNDIPQSIQNPSTDSVVTSTGTSQNTNTVPDQTVVHQRIRTRAS